MGEYAGIVARCAFSGKVALAHILRSCAGAVSEHAPSIKLACSVRRVCVELSLLRGWRSSSSLGYRVFCAASGRHGRRGLMVHASTRVDIVDVRRCSGRDWGLARARVPRANAHAISRRRADTRALRPARLRPRACAISEWARPCAARGSRARARSTASYTQSAQEPVRWGFQFLYSQVSSCFLLRAKFPPVSNENGIFVFTFKT